MYQTIEIDEYECLARKERAAQILLRDQVEEPITRQTMLRKAIAVSQLLQIAQGLTNFIFVTFNKVVFYTQLFAISLHSAKYHLSGISLKPLLEYLQIHKIHGRRS
ncbi:hypothetical protein [Nostoc sp. DedQUE07]|uniref:hypothetical protein n=1 Tax=Nostoc sp. DedQUE07 TaxID=3075392 RepID=UPI002AD3C612|nr:hypothetical protein [Nostoc sp. DedQUE07]MDZ8131941.1 hypothetical protein [Nostoc sp. DedQUE07]